MKARVAGMPLLSPKTIHKKLSKGEFTRGFGLWSL